MSAGLTLVVGGKAMPLAPLNYKALKAQRENIRRVSVMEFTNAYELFDALTGVIHASLARGAPELTVDQVEEALDEPTAEVLYNEVLRISFPAQAGEAAAASPSGASTGTP
ncbi:hypothetical protein ACG02S_07795 [Roseateles sp. DC23W]|uniref:Phage tail assembly chaperone protein, E, or 41 or 14 n=1 Tax=Pelomonas dachongensis TaxID=3299029 RepID=A0ABW7EJZ9_9BURK